MSMKKNNVGLTLKKEEIEEIHMPSNTGLPFIMCVVFGITGFFLVFEWHMAAAVAAVGILAPICRGIMTFINPIRNGIAMNRIIITPCVVKISL
ncbi:hypothetical protein EXW96_10790 [Paenibacillus sp. JMULE4]|nr:hypothetical protein [Paenibacillus sp. JMULE4]